MDRSTWARMALIIDHLEASGLIPPDATYDDAESALEDLARVPVILPPRVETEPVRIPTPLPGRRERITDRPAA